MAKKRRQQTYKEPAKPESLVVRYRDAGLVLAAGGVLSFLINNVFIPTWHFPVYFVLGAAVTVALCRLLRLTHHDVVEYGFAAFLGGLMLMGSPLVLNSLSEKPLGTRELPILETGYRMKRRSGGDKIPYVVVEINSVKKHISFPSEMLEEIYGQRRYQYVTLYLSEGMLGYIIFDENSPNLR
ncbi:hypothetical protein ACWKWU_12050 [Chitinophaga lutea]